ALQPPERLRVHDPVAVALERRPDAALLLGPQAPGGLVGADGERRERRLLGAANPLLEGVRDSARKLRHPPRVDPTAARAIPSRSTLRRRPRGPCPTPLGEGRIATPRANAIAVPWPAPPHTCADCAPIRPHVAVRDSGRAKPRPRPSPARRRW